MQSREVGHVVVEMLVLLADQAGLSWAELCEGLPIDERALRHRSGGLDWELAAEFVERIEARIGPERLRVLTAKVPEISSITRRLLARFVGARLMLRFAFRTFVPSMFPMYELQSEEQQRPDGGAVLHVTATLKPGFRGCRAMFDLHGPSTAALPTLSGEPALSFRAVTSDRSGEYWFDVP